MGGGLGEGRGGAVTSVKLGQLLLLGSSPNPLKYPFIKAQRM